jgi:hypothetical protein
MIAVQKSVLDMTGVIIPFPELWSRMQEMYDVEELDNMVSTYLSLCVFCRLHIDYPLPVNDRRDPFPHISTLTISTPYCDSESFSNSNSNSIIQSSPSPRSKVFSSQNT